METTDIQLPEGITQDAYNKAVTEYGQSKVKFVELPQDDEGKDSITVMMRVPSLKVIGEFEKWLESNPLKAKKIMVNACLLSHKEIVSADDGLFLAAFSGAAQLMPIRKAVIKN